MIDFYLCPITELILYDSICSASGVRQDCTMWRMYQMNTFHRIQFLNSATIHHDIYSVFAASVF